MKRKEIEALKEAPVAELEKNVRTSRERLRELMFDLRAGKTTSLKELRTLRKDVARMLTFLRMKQSK